MNKDTSEPTGQGPWNRFGRVIEWGARGRRSSRVLVLSAVTGVITGGVVAAFEFVVNGQLLTRVLSWPLALQAVAPGAGLLLAWLALRTAGRRASPEMSDEYIRNFHDRHHRLDRRPVMGRMLASAATLGLGGTMGFEGPSIYVGAAIGATIQARLTRYFSRDDAKTLMVAGAAAGMAAIFKAPATGVVFAIEVPYQADLAGRFVLPALCASAVSYATFVLLQSTKPLLPVSGATPFSLVDLGGAVVIGVACGVGARLFALALRHTKRLAQRATLPARVVLAAGMLAALAVASQRITGQALTMGPGYRAIDWALQPRHALIEVAALLLLRVVAVLSTVGGGGAGGLFIPLVVEGALLGRILGGAFGASSGSLFPVLGIAAFLAAGYRTPLTAVMFVAETTGRPGFVVPGLLAAVIAHLLMGRESVAPEQVAARAGHLEKRLRMPVSAALASDAPTVGPEQTVAEFLRNDVVDRHALVAAVVDDRSYFGMMDVAIAEEIPRDERDHTLVRDVMRSDHPVGRPHWPLQDALHVMEEGDVDVLPILALDGRYLGLLSVAAVLALQEILDESDDYGPRNGPDR